MTIKIMVVEDSEEEIETCKSTLERVNAAGVLQFAIEYAKTVDEGLLLVDNTFDGAIVDLRLKGVATAGDEFIDSILAEFRIPVVILTGTPDHIPKSASVPVFKKGEVGYDELFKHFSDVHSTGVTKIFGMRGLVEKHLNRVFWDSVFPHLPKWMALARRGSNTEHAMLRLTLNHLVQILDEVDDLCLPEEMYLVPISPDRVLTGGLFRSKDSAKYVVILSPACDLAVRQDGCPKSDSVQVCGIQPMTDWLKDKNAKSVEKLLRNNDGGYLHWLPAHSGFPGGFVNFRLISHFKHDEFRNCFESFRMQVSPHFLKDLVARFSSYYARQGQPDFAFKELAEDHVTK